MRYHLMLAVLLTGLLAVGNVLQSEARDDRIATLIQQLKNPVAKDRAAAAMALGKAGRDASEAVPALLEALQDRESLVRSNAAWALGFIKSDAPKVVPALVRALEDESEFVRASAASGLGMFGPAAKAAVPNLIQALDDKSAMVRSGAADALGGTGPDGLSAVPKLIERLKDSDEFVRGAAVNSLGLLGPDAKAAVPGLIEALGDTDAMVRRSVAVALANFPTQASKEALKKAAESDKDTGVRKAATESLKLMPGTTGGEVRPDVPTIPPQPVVPEVPKTEVPREARVDVVKTWVTPTPGGFTYHGRINANATGAQEKFTFYTALRYDKAPAYETVKQPNGKDLLFEAQTFTSTATDLKPSFEDVQMNIVAESFRQYAALEVGTHSVRVYWAVYHGGKQGYLTGDEAWRLGTTFTLEKAADGTVRITPPAGVPGPAVPPAPERNPEVRPPVAPTKYQVFQDPSIQKAFTAQVPAGWQVRGGAQQPRLLTTVFQVEATSPDGQIVLRLRVNDAPAVHVDGPIPWPLPPNATHWPITGVGSVPIQQYQPGAAFAVASELPRDAQIGKPMPWPFLARAIGPGATGGQVDAGEVAFTLDRDGQAMRGGAFAVTRKMVNQPPMPTLWHCLVYGSYVAPAAREQEAKNHLIRLANTFRLEPRWVAAQEALIRKSLGIMMEVSEHTSRIISEVFWKRQETYNGIFQADADVRRGVVQLRNGRTGEEYTEDNKFLYYWLTGNGERVGTDDPNPPTPDAEPLLILDIRKGR